MAWILRTILVFMLMDIVHIYSVDPNADTFTTPRGSQVELKCVYVGNGNVSAVEWFNKSSSILTPLILVRNDSEGKFNVFPGSKSPFEMDRVNSSCNLSNICILEINLLPIDDNSNISCNFLDPYGSETKARFTLKVTSAPVTTEVPGSQTQRVGEIAGYAVAGFLVFVAIFSFACYKYYTYKIIRQIPPGSWNLRRRLKC